MAGTNRIRRVLHDYIADDVYYSKACRIKIGQTQAFYQLRANPYKIPKNKKTIAEIIAVHRIITGDT